MRNPSASSALLPDCGFGNRVGREDNRGRRTGLHHRLSDRLLTGEGHLTAAVFDGKTDLPQHIVRHFMHVVVVSDWLVGDHLVFPFRAGSYAYTWRSQ
ncbi:MAG TPA: hypothetical protein DDW48_02185 [Methyloceanibacter sp.]|nr:hypothetical protein [Methyloceanibacter sp.]